MKLLTKIVLFFMIFFHLSMTGQENSSGGLVIARVKYQGGGDWYNDPSAIPNLARYIRDHTLADIADKEAQVALSDESLFSYPVLFLTGHGQWSLGDLEAERLRTYLLRGGFLYVDDDYGLDADFRKAVKKALPDFHLIEISFSHGIYHTPFEFTNGLPKIHEHDNKNPQGFGVFDNRGRLMLYYSYESNISDGWVDPQIYQDPPEKREAALQMGTNIILWALMH
jgi:hypothetical protein